MNTPTKVKLEEVLLSEVYFKFDYYSPPGTDIFDDDNENTHRDILSGKIMYFDCEAFDEDGIEDYSIGTFKAKILYGGEDKIYRCLEYDGSITDVRYQDELFVVKDDVYGGRYVNVRECYYDLMSEVYENKFMILDKVEINDLYRGHGVLKKLIPFLTKTFKIPILIKPYPLQYEGEGMDNDIQFKLDLKKVENSYRKCGFKKGRPKSEYMIKW